jgi:hypothetical protein
MTNHICSMAVGAEVCVGHRAWGAVSRPSPPTRRWCRLRGEDEHLFAGILCLPVEPRFPRLRGIGGSLGDLNRVEIIDQREVFVEPRWGLVLRLLDLGFCHSGHADRTPSSVRMYL